jgi:hypothetical protein
VPTLLFHPRSFRTRVPAPSAQTWRPSVAQNLLSKSKGIELIIETPGCRPGLKGFNVRGLQRSTPRVSAGKPCDGGDRATTGNPQTKPCTKRPFLKSWRGIGCRTDARGGFPPRIILRSDLGYSLWAKDGRARRVSSPHSPRVGLPPQSEAARKCRIENSI